MIYELRLSLDSVESEMRGPTAEERVNRGDKEGEDEKELKGFNNSHSIYNSFQYYIDLLVLGCIVWRTNF